MKKLILLFGIIAVTTMMTSCLEGNNSGEVFNLIVFIDRADNGVIHGRPSNGFITSPQIQDGVLMTNPPVHFDIGRFYLVSYRWDRGFGTTSLGGNLSAENVDIFGAIEVPSVWLTESAALPQTEDMQRFASIPTSTSWLNNPLFIDGAFHSHWRDNWLLHFTWNGGTEAPKIGLFKRERDRDESSNTVDIDVRIIEPSTGNRTGVGSFISFDMSRVRDSFPPTATVTVNFHFYQIDFVEPRMISATWRLPEAN